MKTPHQQNFRMPAEWAAHAATWIAWPHNPADWPGKFQPIPWVYAEIVRHLARVERVHILVNDAPSETRAKKILARNQINLANVTFHRWPTDRVWLRDSGPIFIKNPAGKTAITNWKFNAWAKYPNHKQDDKIPARAAKLLNLPSFEPTVNNHRLVLEGGSIEVNGAGTLITTEECLLSPIQQRNPGITRAQLEQAFRDYLGITQTIWLNRGCAGDDTHGHVDDITRFASESVIFTVTEPNTADENHLPLAENLDRLKSSRTPAGDPWKIIELPMPYPIVFEGQRLPASYANFYIANGIVLVPTFNDPHDRHALNLIAAQFPTRTIIGIACTDFIWGLGALHCMTQQQPA